MFSFSRKKEKTPAEREEKEKRKKEKREKKEKAIRDGGRLSIEDLQRLEEVRKTLGSKGGGVPEESFTPNLSGITADFRQKPISPGSSDGSSAGSGTMQTSSSHLPPVKLPSFSKKGILKGSRGNYDVSRSVSSDLDDMSLVLKNTKDNEYTNVYRRSLTSPLETAPPLPPKLFPSTSPSKKSPLTPEGQDSADREVSYELASVTTKVRRHSNHISPVSPDKHGNFVRSDKRPVSFSEHDCVFNEDCLKGESVGKNHGRPLSCHYPLHMPGLIKDVVDGKENNVVSGIREITVYKNPESRADFGFDLRKFISGGKNVLLIEPIERSCENEIMIMPGDQLVSVNDIKVQDMDREQVMKILRSSTEDALNIKVIECCLPYA